MSERRSVLQANLESVNERIQAAWRARGSGDAPTLVVVTKNFPASDAQLLYELGVRDCGENRDEEGSEKSALLPPDITWHFQGQIQGRKIASIASWAGVVHSLDQLSHAEKFASLADRLELPEFFLQVNLEPERTDRGGVAPSDLLRFIESLPQSVYGKTIGIMTVAPQSMEPVKAFEIVAGLSSQVRTAHPALDCLSMGMSGDFEAAIAQGATHIRLGSSILGSR
jgi:pyridoxal phosphate enzyme (YggS family)